MGNTFKVDFTEEDKASTSKAFEPGKIPSGPQNASVTDVELAEVKTGPNAGKPYLKVEMTIQDGPFENYKLWANVMLFTLTSGNWFLSQFLKATGNASALETGEVPLADAYIGKEVIANVVRVKDKWRNDKEPRPDGSSWFKNEVKGFILDENELMTTPKGRTKKSSILP